MIVINISDYLVIHFYNIASMICHLGKQYTLLLTLNLKAMTLTIRASASKARLAVI